MRKAPNPAARRHAKRCIAKAVSLCLLSALAGCLPPPGGGGPAGPGPQAQRPLPTQVDPTGEWCFRDRRGRRQFNYFTPTDGGMIATPVGRRGSERFYRQIGENAYADSEGPGTYEFITWESAVWRSNDRRRLVFRLRKSFQRGRCRA